MSAIRCGSSKTFTYGRSSTRRFWVLGGTHVFRARKAAAARAMLKDDEVAAPEPTRDHLMLLRAREFYKQLTYIKAEICVGFTAEEALFVSSCCFSLCNQFCSPSCALSPRLGGTSSTTL
jgi:hypothetical protein